MLVSRMWRCSVDGEGREELSINECITVLFNGIPNGEYEVVYAGYAYQ